MSISITSDVNEYNDLDKEIKRLSNELRILKRKRDEAQTRIIEFLNSKNQPGLKYQNIGILLETKEKKKLKPKKVSKGDSIKILHDAGVRDAENVLKLLKDSTSSAQEIQKIKKNYKNFFDLSEFTGKLFNKKIDLITLESLSPRIGPYIKKEVIYA